MLERGYATVNRLSVCLSVRLSVTFGYVFHTGLKTFSQLSSLRYLLTLTADDSRL